MSVSTSLTNSSQPYPSNSSDNQWTQDSNIPQNEQFLVNDLYSINPACTGSSAICNNQKITNVNHCVNNQMSFNPPNFAGSYNPNGSNGQDIRFHNTCTISNPGIMVQGPRNGHFIPSVSSSWASPIRRDRMVSRPTWNTTKTSSGGVKKTKRIRTAFTSQQMMELENEYARARYLDRSRRIELSETLKLNERTIKIWFQNRRMKEKKDKTEGNEDEEATSTTEFAQEPVGSTIMYDPYPNNGVFERNIYVEQYPMVSTLAQHINVPTLAENINNTTFNSYPTFVVDNNTQLVDYDMQCRQINMQMQNYTISPKDDSVDIKDEPIEESSTSDNSTNNCVPKKSDETENWDLSWIRSIQFEEDS